MQIKLWGVRGSLPAPLTNREYRQKLFRVLSLASDYGLEGKEAVSDFMNSLPRELARISGGDTTCVQVTSDSGKIYILDCGTGIRNLGNVLMRGEFGKGAGEANILLTHNHWDHIQGLPFFKPLYVPGNKLNFYSPYKNQEAMLSRQMEAPHFPASFENTLSTKSFNYVDPFSGEPYELEEGLLVDMYPLTHPNGSFGYRFRQGGKTFVFATDAEFTGETLEKQGSDIEFFKNADVLVLDSQYTLEESFMKIDWGHTSYTMAVNCALRWNVRNLVLTHHEPDYDDRKLFENYRMALRHSADSGENSLRIYLAAEGMSFRL